MAGAGPQGATLCIAVACRGADFFAVPSWSLSADIADATQDAAAMVIVLAAKAIQAGEIAMIAPMRSGK